MLSPSDFNNAVPQFTNGDYASSPINPQYIAEPDAVNYNRGAEPLQTLPAQWWNWFLNRITNRFNKVNIYVKNIFNELTQLLSLVSETPSGTEGTPTVGQLKDMFETKYPDYLKTAPALSNTFVPQTTMVNGHALSGNVTVTCVACAGQSYCVMDYCSNATPIYTAFACTGLTCAQISHLAAFSTSYISGKTIIKDVSKSTIQSWLGLGSNAYNSTAFTTCTGTVTQVKVGTTPYNPSSGVISLPAYPSAPTCVACAGKLYSSTIAGWGSVCVCGCDGTNVILGGCSASGSVGITVDKSYCATRVQVYSNAWVASQPSQSSTSIKNCCGFPILAFGYGSNSSFAIYIPANGTASISCPMACIASGCRYGLRLY